MLVLSRKALEQIQIGDNVVVTILQVKGQTVRIGIDAPRDVRVLRSELPRNEDGAKPATATASESTATTKRTAARAGRIADNIASPGAAPLANRLEARRSPRLPSIDDFARRNHRLEMAASPVDVAVRSKSFAG